MSKYEDTRIVTFQEDYTVPTEKGGTRVLYKKGTTHAMHKSIADKLKEKGAKCIIVPLDHKKIIEERKKAFEKRREQMAK